MVKKYLLAIAASALLATFGLTAHGEAMQSTQIVSPAASTASGPNTPAFAASAAVVVPTPVVATVSAIAVTPKSGASTSATSGGSSQTGLGVLPIVVMAIIALYGTYLALRGLEQTRSIGKLQEEAAQTLLNAPVMRDAAESLAPNSPYRLITEDALESFHKHALVRSQIPLDRWLALSLSIAKPKIFPSTQISTLAIKALANAVLLIGVCGFIGELMFAFMGTATNTASNLLAHIGSATMVPVVGLMNWMALQYLCDKTETNNNGNRQRFDSYCRELVAVILRVAHKMEYGVNYHTIVFGTTRGGMSQLAEPGSNAPGGKRPQIAKTIADGAVA